MLMDDGQVQTKKVKSVVKFSCGIRLARILQGYEWNLTTNPLVQIAIKSLKKKYPTSNVLQKIPLSLTTLLEICKCMNGWPLLHKLSFNDLTWATTSCVAFSHAFVEASFSPNQNLNVQSCPGSCNTADSPHWILCLHRSPFTQDKERSGFRSAIAMSTTSSFLFDPVVLLKAYRSRALDKSVNALGKNAAFKSTDGKPIDRVFMISRAEKLRAAAGIRILNAAGKPIKVSDASWRAALSCLRVKQVSCLTLSEPMAGGHLSADQCPTPLTQSKPTKRRPVH